MLLIIILNVVFSAFVVLAISGLHLWAIYRSHVEERERARVRLAASPATRTRPRSAPARRFGPATMTVRREAAGAHGLR